MFHCCSSARLSRALTRAVGVLVVSAPHLGYNTLAIVIGIWLIINGLAWIGLGIVSRASR